MPPIPSSITTIEKDLSLKTVLKRIAKLATNQQLDQILNSEFVLGLFEWALELLDFPKTGVPGVSASAFDGRIAQLLRSPASEDKGEIDDGVPEGEELDIGWGGGVAIDVDDYWTLLQQYARQHTVTTAVNDTADPLGSGHVFENLHGDLGYWNNRERMYWTDDPNRNMGDHYLHSTYGDLVLAGLLPTSLWVEVDLRRPCGQLLRSASKPAASRPKNHGNWNYHRVFSAV